MSQNLPTPSSMQSYVFSTTSAFESAQRMATSLSKSNLVPKDYQNNMPNALVALEVAQRIGASPLMVMQNLYIVHGRPSWSSQFVIAAINTCGRFQPLQFTVTGEGDEKGCVAWALPNGVEISKEAYDIAQQEKISLLDACKQAGVPLYESPRVSIQMAKDEGWYSRNGSKWKTIPDLMLRYRSASFFGRLYAPEILMGMRSEDESAEMIDVTPSAASEIQRDLEAEAQKTASLDSPHAEGTDSTGEAEAKAEAEPVIPSFMRSDQQKNASEAQPEEAQSYTVLAPDGEIVLQAASLAQAADFIKAQRNGIKVQKTLDAFNTHNATVIGLAEEAGLL